MVAKTHNLVVEQEYSNVHAYVYNNDWTNTRAGKHRPYSYWVYQSTWNARHGCHLLLLAIYVRDNALVQKASKHHGRVVLSCQESALLADAVWEVSALSGLCSCVCK